MHHRHSTIVAGLAVAIALTGCDLPTQPPDFSFSSNVRTPILFEQTFELLGTSDSGNNVLIDTTSTAFDSLFTVESDQTIYLIQEVGDLDFGDVGELISGLDVDTTSFNVTLGDLARQSFSTGFGESIGVYESAAASLPAIPLSVEGSKVYHPVGPESVLQTPAVAFLDLSGASLNRVTLTGESGPVNNLRFRLTNGTSVQITDGTFTSGSVPRVVLEDQSGSELATAFFNISPAPGQTAEAILDLASHDIPRTSRFRMDIGTPVGLAPIQAEPHKVPTSIAMSPLRYNEFEVDQLPEQPIASVGQSGVGISSQTTFIGLVTKSGSLQLQFTNDMDVPVDVARLTATTDHGVDTFSAGSIAFEAPVLQVAARSSATYEIDLAGRPLASSLSIDVEIGSPGSTGPVSVRSVDGFRVDVAGDVEIDRIVLIPNGEGFSGGGDISVDDTYLRLESASDFVALSGGELHITELVNGMDVGFDDVTISFPDIRRAPYMSSDSLVLRFSSDGAKSGEVLFPEIARQSQLGDVVLDLTGMRIYATGNTLTYRISARSESAGDERVIRASDEIRAGVAATGLAVGEVRGYLNTFSSNITTDANGDGQLDIADSREAIVSSLGDMDAIANRVSGLAVSGSDLSISIRTNLTPSAILYGVVAGRTSTGETIFLGGRGDYTVMPGDSMLASFSEAGSPMQSTDLIAFPIGGAADASTPETQTIVFNASNSTVDDFVAALPTELRIVARGVVQPGGGSVTLRQPIVFEAAVGVSIPLNLSGGFNVTQDVNADLTSISDLTDPASTVFFESAILNLDYGNSIPLGAEVRIEVLDASGFPVLSMPAAESPAYRLDGAPTSSDGTSSGPAQGTIAIELTEAELRGLAEGHQMLLQMAFDATGNQTSRLRSTDAVSIGMRGDFRINVTVN